MSVSTGSSCTAIIPFLYEAGAAEPAAFAPDNPQPHDLADTTHCAGILAKDHTVLRSAAGS